VAGVRSYPRTTRKTDENDDEREDEHEPHKHEDEHNWDLDNTPNQRPFTGLSGWHCGCAARRWRQFQRFLEAIPVPRQLGRDGPATLGD
jgi:hypothetical protein